jgi:O-antigen biosynthesis protein
MSRPYRILNIINDVSSCAYYRNVLPVIYCRDELKECGIELTNQFSFDPEQKYDCQVWSRIPDPNLFPYIYDQASRGVKIVWDIDDELWNIPTWNPASKHFTHHLLNFLSIYLSRFAYRVTCSTVNLAHSIHERYKYPLEKISILENLVATDVYDKFLNKNKKHSDTPFKILWSGGSSHEEDIAPIMRICDHFGNKVQIMMFGYINEKIFEKHPNQITFVPFTGRKYFEGLLTMLSAHVSVIPLIDCQFNRCKSAIKYYESSLAGMASIVSNVEPYSNVIHGWSNCLCVSSEDFDSDKWIHACERLINDPDLWESIIENSMNNVISNYSWQTENPRKRDWINFYRSIPSIDDSK